MLPTWVTAKDLRQRIQLSEAQLKSLRRHEWVEGVHFVRPSSRSVLYNPEAIEHWLQHRDTDLHQQYINKAIKRFR